MASGNLRPGSRYSARLTSRKQPGAKLTSQRAGCRENGESLVSGDQLEEVVYGPPAPHWLMPHGLLIGEESNGAVAVGDEAASIRGVSFRPEEEITHVFSPTGRIDRNGAGVGSGVAADPRAARRILSRRRPAGDLPGAGGGSQARRGEIGVP